MIVRFELEAMPEGAEYLGTGFPIALKDECGRDVEVRDDHDDPAELVRISG